jgi:hypothetical protein
VNGSIVADQTNLNGVDIHYDRSVLRAYEECEGPPPTECSTCGDCAASAACIDGLCGVCRDDGDCCAPLVCVPEIGCTSLLI